MPIFTTRTYHYRGYDWRIIATYDLGAMLTITRVHATTDTRQVRRDVFLSEAE